MPDFPSSSQDHGEPHDFDDDLEDLALSEEAQIAGEPDAGLLEARNLADDIQRRETSDVLEGLRKMAAGDPVRWSLWRIDGDDLGFLTTFSTVQLSQERIRDDYGPGTYRVEGMKSNGRYLARRTITIAGDAPRREKSMNVANVPAFNVAEFLAQQEARDNTRRQDEERARREREEREDKRRAELHTLVISALPSVATVVAAMFGNRTDPLAIAAALRPAPGPDPLAMIAALKQLAPEQPKGPAPMEQALQLFEVLADKAGANGGQTAWLDVVKEGVRILAPAVGGVIEQAAQARASAAPQPHSNGQSPPHQPPVAALAAPAQPEPSGDPSMLDLLPHLPWLRSILKKCVSAAARNRDPDLYAAMLLEDLPEGITPERLKQLLDRQDWLQQLSRLEPQIGQTSADWWQSLHTSLMGFINEALTPQPKPATGEVERPVPLPSLTGESS